MLRKTLRLSQSHLHVDLHLNRFVCGVVHDLGLFCLFFLRLRSPCHFLRFLRFVVETLLVVGVVMIPGRLFRAADKRFDVEEVDVMVIAHSARRGGQREVESGRQDDVFHFEAIFIKRGFQPAACELERDGDFSVFVADEDDVRVVSVGRGGAKLIRGARFLLAALLVAILEVVERAQLDAVRLRERVRAHELHHVGAEFVVVRVDENSKTDKAVGMAQKRAVVRDLLFGVPKRKAVGAASARSARVVDAKADGGFPLVHLDGNVVGDEAGLADGLRRQAEVLVGDDGGRAVAPVLGEVREDERLDHGRVEGVLGDRHVADRHDALCGLGFVCRREGKGRAATGVSIDDDDSDDGGVNAEY